MSLVSSFERARPRLRGIAYRVLGSFSEADDAVQEAWIRLSRAEPAHIGNLDGWLTTVVSRICLDVLRQRRGRREVSVGLDPAELSDPVEGRPGPEDEALLSDALSRALLVVLNLLTPSERLAFVLHDLFKVPFGEIGPILGKSPGAAKVMASRARRRVLGAEPGQAQSPARHREIVAAFVEAARGGDIDCLIQLLDPDVVLRAEIGGPGEVVVEGAEAVSGRAVLFGGEDTRSEIAPVDHTLGLLTLRGDVVVAAMQVVVRDDWIVELRLTTVPATITAWTGRVPSLLDEP